MEASFLVHTCFVKHRVISRETVCLSPRKKFKVTGLHQGQDFFNCCCWSTLVSRWRHLPGNHTSARGVYASRLAGPSPWRTAVTRTSGPSRRRRPFSEVSAHTNPPPRILQIYLAAEDQNKCTSVVVFTARVRCGIAPRKLDPRAPLEPDWSIVPRSFLTPSITPEPRSQAAARANGGCPWTTMTNRQRTPRADPTPGSPCRP